MDTDEKDKQAKTAAESTPSATDATQQSKSGTYPSLELTRVILEFLGKMFYPAIIIAIIYLLWPAVSDIDFNKLFGNIKSAKVGNVELTFSQAQDIGAEIAPLNSKVAELERKLSAALSNMQKLQEVAKLPKLSTQEMQAYAEKEQALKANSIYTVLVFHRVESKERAAMLTRDLLSRGYQSSDTETNFSELKKVKPEENVIFLTYTSEGKKILPDLQKYIAEIAPKADIRVNPRPINLKRGDVQILVF